MTVKITFLDGTSLTFTGVTDYLDEYGFISFKGVETPPGTTSTEETFNWVSIRRVSRSTPPTGPK